MTGEAPGEKTIHVVFLSDRLPYPQGMASTARVKLLARALAEQGVDVKVLTLHVTELPPLVENSEVRGSDAGIPFEYAAGATVRSDEFVVRRVREMRGLFVGAARLLQWRLKGELDGVYLYWTTHHLTLQYWVVVRFLRLLRVPVVRELNERPWSLRPSASWLERRITPVSGMAAVVAISEFIATWARNQARQRGSSLEVIEIPVLVDVDEQRPSLQQSAEQRVVYAASSGYPDATRFVIEAMQSVWREYPSCRLVITGTNPGDPMWRWLLDDADHLDDRISLPGYLPRDGLLRLYRDASALLAPLFDDLRSEARFPTKIGEYLASGTPVVSSAVGEVRARLSDGTTAFLAPAGDRDAFAGRIVAALDDPARARTVGLAGRELAGRVFQYSNHGPRLLAVIRAVSRET